MRIVGETGAIPARCYELCEILQPGVIVGGGDRGERPELLAGVHEATIQRSLPLASGEPAIEASRLGDRVAQPGAAT